MHLLDLRKSSSASQIELASMKFGAYMQQMKTDVSEGSLFLVLVKALKLQAASIFSLKGSRIYNYKSLHSGKLRNASHYSL